MRWILLVAILFYGAFLLVLFVGQRSMLYPGRSIPVAKEPEAVPGLERFVLPIAGGEVEALFLPAPEAEGVRQPAVIFAHGNYEVVDSSTAQLDGFRERGIGVLLVEFPGYGRSTGITTEASIRLAMTAAFDRLASDRRVDPARIIGFGRSLGGGAICLLARDRPLRALILESTFPSLSIFASRYFAPAFLLRDRFDNELALKAFAGPVLVIHGRADTLIPWKHAERLARASAHATFRLYDCGHGGCWDPEALPLWRDVEELLAAAGIPIRKG
ncbi:MAG: alpha/beta hydrolase [Thermoanaerobaculia bacterium]